MIATDLTEILGIRLPVVAAPMAGVSGPDLAIASSRCGALGTLAIGSTANIEKTLEDLNAIRATEIPFGVGVMAWSLKNRPELLDIAIKSNPKLISVSFGDFEPYVELVKQSGILVTTQVGNFEEFDRAVKVGVDLIVARGAEGGGHGLNHVSTLQLLQEILGRTKIPIIAAGGIGSGRGLAAVIAAGAAGAWIGTALIASEESLTLAEAKKKIIEANSDDTIYTHVFDVVQDIPWPKEFAGRALRNSFTDKWHESQSALADDQDARQKYQQAVEKRDFDNALIYAGQSVGLINQVLPAGTILMSLVQEAEYLLSMAATKKASSSDR